MNKFFKSCYIRKVAGFNPEYSYGSLVKPGDKPRTGLIMSPGSFINPKQRTVMTNNHLPAMVDAAKQARANGQTFVPMNLTLPPQVAARLRASGLPKKANTQTYNFQSQQDKQRYINKDNTSRAGNAASAGLVGMTAGMSAGGLMTGLGSGRALAIGGALGALAGGLYGALKTKGWNAASQKNNEAAWNKMTNNGTRRGSLTTTTTYNYY